MQADTLIADKAFDADERVIAPLAAAGKTAVITAQGKPATASRLRPIHLTRRVTSDRSELLRQTQGSFVAIATRYDKTARNFLAAIHLTAGLIWLN